MSTIERKYYVYRGEGCKKMFCESLRKYAMINFEKRKMIALTEKQQESYKKTKICHICKKISNSSALMMKNITELEIAFIIQASTELLHIAYVI